MGNSNSVFGIYKKRKQAHFHLRSLCIEHYVKAGTTRAEWCFGLALAHAHSEPGSKLASNPDKSSGKRFWLFLKKQSDSTNPMSKLIQRKQRFSLSLLERSEYADIILQQILQDHKDSLKIKEGVTSAYQKDKPQLAINLFKECYNTNKQRQKNLVRLGYFVSLSIWKRSRNLANLELSIKYQIEVVGKEENSKIFDLTFLAGILLQKYVCHTKNNKIKNDLKKINSKIAKELKKKKKIN